MTDAELDVFIEDAERHQGGDEWWFDDFFEEAENVGKELKMWREQTFIKYYQRRMCKKCGMIEERRV